MYCLILIKIIISLNFIDCKVSSPPKFAGPFNFEAAKTKGGLPQLQLNPYSWSKVGFLEPILS